MDEKKAGLSDTFKKNTAPKSFIKNPIKGTKFTIAISSAKGGVGKSTFAMNFALALKSIGLKVGILDADIYGPSLPKMMSISEKPKSEDGKSMEPINQYGLQCMSIGFLVDEETPMIWRGPMVTSAIKTFTQKVLWNDLDFIVVDMPPGTGDTQLTFAQEIKVDGVIIISTPQEIALSDVKRGIRMFDKLKVPILGLIDNMSFFESEEGKKYNIFGEGGVEKLSNDYKKEFLGKIPINIDLRIAADSGKPLMEASPEHKISKIFIEIAKKVNESLRQIK
jgi:ATP-binding protein involved in chromosome partitioning